jgi:Zn(2)-Cys(6) binuclear cluster domain-containing protein
MMESSSGGTSPVSGTLPKQIKAQSYPRKRVSRAVSPRIRSYQIRRKALTPLQCDVCRARKTRCDAKKPSCLFCKDLNIVCVYSKPRHVHRRPKNSQQQRPVDPSSPPRQVPDDNDHEGPQPTTSVLERLDKIEIAISSLSGTSSATAEPFGTSKTVTSPVYQGYWPTVRATFPSQQGKYAYRIPSMLVFETACPLHSRWSYNHLRDFYADQLGSISDMSVKLRLPGTRLDLSKSNVLDLQQAFVSNILSFVPVIDREKYQELLKKTADTGYDAAASETCLILLACALGSCSQNTALHSTDSAQLPGFPYFSKAIAFLERTSEPVTDLTTLQCHILIS